MSKEAKARTEGERRQLQGIFLNSDFATEREAMVPKPSHSPHYDGAAVRRGGFEVFAELKPGRRMIIRSEPAP